MNTNEQKTTRTIAGQAIALVRGKRYLASRPIASRGRKAFPVSICEITRSGLAPEPTLVIDGLDYEASTRLVNEFNNEAMSFSGRIW